MHAHDKHLQFRVFLGEHLDEFDTGGTGQRNVDDGQIHLLAREQGACFVGIAGLGADVQIGFPIDQLRDSLTHHHVVVDNHDAGFGRQLGYGRGHAVHGNSLS